MLCSLARHLHAVVRVTRLIHTEWQAGLAALTRAGEVATPERNEFVQFSDLFDVSMWQNTDNGFYAAQDAAQPSKNCHAMLIVAGGGAFALSTTGRLFRTWTATRRPAYAPTRSCRCAASRNPRRPRIC